MCNDVVMGTNFYHRYNHCDCCGRYDERHIGKNMTMFQGYRQDPDWPDPTPEIVSWQQWKEILRTEGEVWDEYHRLWDLEAFISAVENTDPARRRRQYDWVMRHRFTPKHLDWLDADGFSFHEGDFS